MSLRARLLLVTVGLVTLGLLIADVVTYRALSSSLLQRVDEQIAQVTEAAVTALEPGRRIPDARRAAAGFGRSPDRKLRGAARCVGHRRAEPSFGYHPDNGPIPVLPAGLPGSTTGGIGSVTFSARSSSGGSGFRVQAWGLARAPEPS